MEFQRHHRILFFIIIAILIVLLFVAFATRLSNKLLTVQLPKPVFSSQTSIEEALLKRRSIRIYKNQTLALQEVAQLLWAAQGITSNNGLRTAPSAGALYPIEIYLVAGAIENLSPGIYHYVPANHSLEKLRDGDARIPLSKAALGQEDVKLGAADIVITAVFSRTIKKYGDQGQRFVFIEAGHVAQNIFLQSVSLHLGTVSIGGLDDNQVKKVLNIKEDPIYIMPIGKI